MRILRAWEKDFSLADTDVTSFKCEFLEENEGAPDLQKLIHEFVSAGVIQIDPVACKFDGIAAAYDIDDEPAVRHYAPHPARQ